MRIKSALLFFDGNLRSKVIVIDFESQTSVSEAALYSADKQISTHTNAKGIADVSQFDDIRWLKSAMERRRIV